MEDGYPLVWVTGAPGYADFEGELILAIPVQDSREWVCVIGSNEDSFRDVHVIPAQHVILVTEG